jgi:hypothetical protein
MRVLDRQLFRLVLVFGLGGGLAAIAAQPEKPKLAVREKPAPIIMAVALENTAPTASDVGARVDQCSLNPRDYADDRSGADKNGKPIKKRKVVVCG